MNAVKIVAIYFENSRSGRIIEKSLVLQHAGWLDCPFEL